MKALIMAGGEGTRLRPLTYNQPKPMIPMVNRPLMEHVIDPVAPAWFHRHRRLPGQCHRELLRQRGRVRGQHRLRQRGAPLGTAGSVRNAMRQLDEPFLVISGDVLTDIDLSALLDFHYRTKALATIALRSMPNPLEFGIVMTGPDGAVERFLEKPSWGQVFSDTINTGIYVLEPGVFDFIPDGVVDFSADVFPRLLDQERPLLYGCVTDGYWEDIGTLDAYARAHQDILDGRVQVQLPGFCLRQGIWLGDGAEVDPNAVLRGPAVIGDYCRVEAGATLGEYTVLGRNVRVGPDAFVERAVVHDNACLGPGVRLRGCTVGRSSELRRGARIEEGVVLGDECFIGEHAVVHAGVKVFPFKTVEHGAIVNSSIVWESRGARHLFGRNGISGLANVDITPELAVRLAMAFATGMPRGATVAVSRDTSRAARVLKQALIVGLNAAEADVIDLEVATVPVTRFGVRNEHSAGGVTVRLAYDDPQSVVLGFIDPAGVDISELALRKIERVFYREDFRRCLASETGDVAYPARIPDLYAQALVDQVDTRAIRAAHFKVVLDYAFGAASFVMPAVLGQLGAEVLSLNPYAAARRSVTFDRLEHAQGVSTLVRAAGAHCGAVLGPDGERIMLIDDNGRVLSDGEGLMALLGLLLGLPPGAASGTSPAPGLTVARPVSAPSAAEAMCRQAGAELIWTKLSPSHLMEVASRPGVDFAAGQEGGYIFPHFLPSYDAVAALVHAFALLAATGTKLSSVVAALPQVFSAHEAVVTPWERRAS